MNDVIAQRLAQGAFDLDNEDRGEPIKPHPADTVAAARSDFRHNQTAKVSELQEIASIHERRVVDLGDIDRQAVLAQQPDQLLPFPVMEEEGRLTVVDGSVLLAAINQYNADAIVPIEFVDIDEALRIRARNFATPAIREPMAKCRRALILREAGKSNTEIARALKIDDADPALTDGRISQIIAAAKTEQQFAALIGRIIGPARVPVRFWEQICGTMKVCEEADRQNPLASGEARAAAFSAKIIAVCDAGTRYDVEALYGVLGINLDRTPKRRARSLGEKIAIPGTGKHIGFDPDRKGGALFNLPGGLTREEVRHVLDAVIGILAETIKPKDGASRN